MSNSKIYVFVCGKCDSCLKNEFTKPGLIKVEKRSDNPCEEQRVVKRPFMNTKEDTEQLIDEFYKEKALEELNELRAEALFSKDSRVTTAEHAAVKLQLGFVGKRGRPRGKKNASKSSKSMEKSSSSVKSEPEKPAQPKARKDVPYRLQQSSESPPTSPTSFRSIKKRKILTKTLFKLN